MIAGNLNGCLEPSGTRRARKTATSGKNETAKTTEAPSGNNSHTNVCQIFPPWSDSWCSPQPPEALGPDTHPGPPKHCSCDQAAVREVSPQARLGPPELRSPPKPRRRSPSRGRAFGRVLAVLQRFLSSSFGSWVIVVAVPTECEKLVGIAVVVVVAFGLILRFRRRSAVSRRMSSATLRSDW